MTGLLGKLGPKARKGSKPRCHWLTHGAPEQVAERLTRFVEPWGTVASKDKWMPQGFLDAGEAELHNAPRLLKLELGQQLRDWWLAVVKGRPRTPNWDIASTCTVTANGMNKPGLLLVEAKAHAEELDKEKAGKVLRHSASDNSRRNHRRIGTCIRDASLALTAATGFLCALSRDRNYQMSNRFAWSVKLTELGLPVILVYLGFLNAAEMDKGMKKKHFADYDEWKALVKSHSSHLFPEGVWNAPWTLHGQAFMPLIRSMEIPYEKLSEGSAP